MLLRTKHLGMNGSEMDGLVLKRHRPHAKLNTLAASSSASVINIANRKKIMYNIFAYTGPTPPEGYPEYVSINRSDNGQHTITVRSKGDGGRNTVTVELPEEKLQSLRNSLMAHPFSNEPAQQESDNPVHTEDTPQPEERYAGPILDTDGNLLYHLFLMAQRPTDLLRWEDAMEWAKSIGGCLPTRQEQSLLYANCKPHLDPSYHWSCDTHDGNRDYAWYCSFNDGGQYTDSYIFECSAVAVRRVYIGTKNDKIRIYREQMTSDGQWIRIKEVRHTTEKIEGMVRPGYRLVLQEES